MKLLLTLCFTTLFFYSYSQEYISMSGHFYPNAGSNYGGGVLLSAGKYLTGATLGLGAGIMLFGEEDPYLPVFVDFGYIGKKKIAPYFNAKMGWSFFEGSGEFIGEKNQSSLKGGLFFNVAAGANYNFGKGFRVAPFAAISAIMLRKKLLNKTEAYTGSLFNTGIVLMHAR